MLLAALGLAAVLSLVAPAAASADLTNVVPDLVERALTFMFGTDQAGLTVDFASWLTQMPNFQRIAPAGPPSSYPEFLDSAAPVVAASRGHLDDLRKFTTMMSLGLLGAVMTLAVVRYWLAGLSISGSGGIEAVEGFSRCLLAVALILIWPEAFTLLIALANSATDALLGWPPIEENLRTLWRITTKVAVSPVMVNVAPFVSIIVLVAFIMMMLALVVMKVLLTAGLALLYVAMPILLGLRPLPETSWMTRAAGRAFFVCLMVPFTWALIFCTFAVFGMDSLTGQGLSGSWVDALVKPLATIAMLGLAIQLPRQMGRAAMLGAVGEIGGRGGGGGGGMIGRTASYLVARRLDSMASAHIPEALGGQREQIAGRAAARAAKLAGGGGGPVNAPAVQTAWQKAFGNSTFRADDAAFAAVRDPARRRFEGHLNSLRKGAPLRAATRASLVGRARLALDDLTPEQRVAAAASIRDNPSGFAWNTANSSLDRQSLTPQQCAALDTLGEMPREVLADAFTQQEWDDGGALAGIAPQTASSGSSSTQQPPPVPSMPTQPSTAPTQPSTAPTQPSTAPTKPSTAPAGVPTQPGSPSRPSPAQMPQTKPVHPGTPPPWRATRSKHKKKP